MIRPSSLHSNLWLLLHNEKHPPTLHRVRREVPKDELVPWYAKNPRKQRKGKSGELPRR